MRQLNIIFLLFFSALLKQSFAQIPVIEIRINNTVRAKDDYVGSSYIPCGIRVINGSNFSSDIPVQLRNIRGNSGGQVLFSTSNSSKVTPEESLNLNVRRDNSFTTFYIKAKPGFDSKIDKDAVIEALHNDPNKNPTILARKAFMVIPANPLPLTAPQVEIEINTESTLDDYVTWAPTLCKIRLSNYSKFNSPQTFTLRNMPGAVGKVNFAAGSTPPQGSAGDSTLTLTLPNSGSWVNFYISGRFGNPSSRDKDAVIEAVYGSAQEVINREALMVRVRKNANRLTIQERDCFLDALVTLNSTFNLYQTFVDIHNIAGRPEAHDGPAFLPWHRVFLLDLERKLQSIDPAVTLPYWKFDEPAVNLFSPDFIGSKPTESGDLYAILNSKNPLSGWITSGVPGIRRRTRYEDNTFPSRSDTRNELATLALGTDYRYFRRMETNPHGQIHTESGQSGDWIVNLSTAVRDPLFFLLHANVDRQWAKWQWINERFEPTDLKAYSLQGSFDPSVGAHIGHFVKDTMWPWNGITGTYDGSGTIPLDQRPTTAPGGEVAEALSFEGAPVGKPEPYHVINYKNNVVAVSTNSGLGFCYDDIPF